MKKQFVVIFFLISAVSFLKSQTKNQHIIGLNVDYSTMPTIINAHLGTNFTYLYAYKYFCIRAEFGVLPGSNFGTLIKTCLNFGATTNLNNPISFHAVTGIGGLTATQTFQYNNFVYDAEIGNVTIDLGVLVRPLKNDRFFLGLDMMLTGYDVYPKGYMTEPIREKNSFRGKVFFFNLSVNYKINGRKKTDKKDPTGSL
ncbi:MAG: hypothetical protein H7141_06510 [Burkholderiales bacterium]|nr:hypothetical protein [Bacteroidia bacterium]